MADDGNFIAPIEEDLKVYEHIKKEGPLRYPPAKIKNKSSVSKRDFFKTERSPL